MEVYALLLRPALMCSTPADCVAVISDRSAGLEPLGRPPTTVSAGRNRTRHSSAENRRLAEPEWRARSDRARGPNPNHAAQGRVLSRGMKRRTRRRQSYVPIEIVPWCRFCPRSGASNEWRQINETSDEEGGHYKMWCDESLSATFLPVNAYDDVGARTLGAQAWQFKS